MLITFIKSLRWDISWAAAKLVAVLALLGMSVGGAGAYCFGLFLKHPLLGNMAWLYGRMDYVSVGAWFGGYSAAWLGVLGFMLAQWRNPALIQPIQLNKAITLLVKSCLIGIAICVINGAAFGALISCKLAENNIEITTANWPLPPWFAPPAMIAAEGALNGYLWGIVVGFSFGAIYGFYQASKKPTVGKEASLSE